MPTLLQSLMAEPNPVTSYAANQVNLFHSLHYQQVLALVLFKDRPGKWVGRSLYFRGLHGPAHRCRRVSISLIQKERVTMYELCRFSSGLKGQLLYEKYMSSRMIILHWFCKAQTNSDRSRGMASTRLGYGF